MSFRLQGIRVSIFNTIASLLALTSLAVPAQAGQLGNERGGLPRAIPNLRSPHPMAAGAAIAGYTPAQIRHAYGVDKLPWDGAGQTIAIIEAFGSTTIRKDLAKFSTQFHLPPAQLRIVYPQGKPTTEDTTWSLETALDVEWAHAIAPKAKLLLVVTLADDFYQLMAAVDYAVTQGANQISMSFGAPEFSVQTTLDSHFDVPGVSFFASSGDVGVGVQWPASSPKVTGVGGTTLKLDSSGKPLQPETAWSGSSGGISQYYSIPAFQSTLNAMPSNSGQRGVPDVAFNADPATGYAVYHSKAYAGFAPGWMKIGGTSAGSPQWAALSALENSKRASSMKTMNDALYQVIAAGGYSKSFADISSGCDGGQVKDALDCAKTGYDYVTGLGSPRSNVLLQNLLKF